MQGLMRLAGWGVAASAGLLFAAIAANSGSGRDRLSAAFAGVNGTQAAEAARAEALQAAQLARLAANESDTRRLTEIVRSLAGDRERLLTRLASIERGLEDVTGSIQKQAVNQKQAAATPPAAPAAPPSPPPAAAEPPPKMAAVPPQTVAPAQPTPPAQAPKPPANAQPAAIPELEAIPGRPAAGVDIGGAKDFDGLRTLWNTINASYGELFDGLHPIVSVRENNKSRGAELRLIAGPLTDVESASKICTTLATAKRYCRLVTFEGQPLALNVPEQRRPGARTRPLVRAP
jgi:hypothetical protein